MRRGLAAEGHSAFAALSLTINPRLGNGRSHDLCAMRS